MTHWVLDIETLTDFSKIRMAGLANDHGISILCHYATDLEREIRQQVEPNDTIWTWNGKKFDEPMIKDLWMLDLNELASEIGFNLCDAMILAKMIYPDQAGGHSLDNFTKRYNVNTGRHHKSWKPDDPDWYNTASDTDLAHYLFEDLKNTLFVIRNLSSDAKNLGGKWSHGLKVEQRVRELTNMQAKKGVRFDIDEAVKLVETLDREMEIIEEDLSSWLPELPVPKPHMPPKLQYKKTGEMSEIMKRYMATHNLQIHSSDVDGTQYVSQDGKYVGDMPLTVAPRQVEKLTLAQQPRLKQWLLDYHGWDPTWWNTKYDSTGKKVRTSPRLNHPLNKTPCPNLAKIGKQGEDISRWLMLRSRRSLLSNASGSTGLIKRAVENGGYIPSDADTCGTNTARYRHKGIVNIPRPSSAYGLPLRGLFCARHGYRWVGWDAASLEARIEAHYTHQYDPIYADSLVHGDSVAGTDIHSRNMRLLDLPDRDAAKTFKYSATYGAQPPSLAIQLGIPKSEASDLFDEFWDKNVGLRKLKEQLYREWVHYNKKYIVGLDGRLIATRSEHSLINAKFQSGGAIVMKHAMLLAHKSITAYAANHRIEAYGLIRYHDEEQWETNGSYDQAVEIGELGVQSIVKAGEYLNLAVALDGEASIGNSWAETH